MNEISQIVDLAYTDERFKEQFIKLFLQAYYSDNKNLITIKNGNKIIAFAHYWMITTDALNKLKDLQFNVEKMKRIVSIRGNNLHVISVIIDKNFRNNGLIFKVRTKLKETEPFARTLSWMTPKMDELIIHRIIRRK